MTLEAVRAYEEYAACFDTAEERVEFEAQCLSIGDEFLPEIARQVRDDEVEYAPAEYWRWLLSQIDAPGLVAEYPPTFALMPTGVHP